MKNLFLGLLLGLVMVSCDKEDDLSRYYWDQTKCSDPWNTGENDTNDNTREAVTTFLENNGISFIEVSFDDMSPLNTFCESCACGTGQRVIVNVMERDEDKMEELGFYNE